MNNHITILLPYPSERLAPGAQHTPKFTDVQVPYIKRCSTTNTVGPPNPWVSYLRIQPIMDGYFPHVKSSDMEDWLYIYWNKSVYKWTRTIQTPVVLRANCIFLVTLKPWHFSHSYLKIMTLQMCNLSNCFYIMPHSSLVPIFPTPNFSRFLFWSDLNYGDIRPSQIIIQHILEFWVLETAIISFMECTELFIFTWFTLVILS